ncbi:hypothetical protein HK096_003100 [Nowakowskiella sp. JEL0078]|nr:hypothetical protein HK096_003100 [Nowakowskiella sp. JEL0078]
MNNKSAWSEGAQMALSQIPSPSSSSNLPHPPPKSPRRQQSSTTQQLRSSVYENLGIPTDYDDEYSRPPGWSPPEQNSGPSYSEYDNQRRLQFEKKTRTKNEDQSSYSSRAYSAYDIRQSQIYDRESKAYTISSKAGKELEAEHEKSNVKRRSHHIPEAEVREVFASEDDLPSGSTMKWKWNRPQRRDPSSVVGTSPRRRMLCAVFVIIALTSGTSVGLSSSLINRSIYTTNSAGGTLEGDSVITQAMLKMASDDIFALVISMISFFVAISFAITYFLQPSVIEDKVAKFTARLFTFQRRAVFGLLSLVLLISAWCAVTMSTSLTKGTCNSLNKLSSIPSDDYMVMVGIGRQLSLLDCRVNDGLMAFAIIGMLEWIVAFVVVVEGHARRMSSIMN